MLDPDITAIIAEIRESPFADLAQSLTVTLNEGKSELVKERKPPRKVDPNVVQRVVFDAIEAVGLNRKQREKLDIRVRPFETAEATEVVLRAIKRKFVEPAALLDPISRLLERFEIESAVFIDEYDDRNSVSLEDFRTAYSDDAIIELKNTIGEELGEGA